MAAIIKLFFFFSQQILELNNFKCYFIDSLKYGSQVLEKLEPKTYILHCSSGGWWWGNLGQFCQHIMQQIRKVWKKCIWGKD